MIYVYKDIYTLLLSTKTYGNEAEGCLEKAK